MSRSWGVGAACDHPCRATGGGGAPLAFVCCRFPSWANGGTYRLCLSPSPGGTLPTTPGPSVPTQQVKARGAVFVMCGQVGRGPCGLVLPCFCWANRKLPGPPPRVPPRLAGLGSVQARDRFYIKASYPCDNRWGGGGGAEWLRHDTPPGWGPRPTTTVTRPGSKIEFLRIGSFENYSPAQAL